MGGGIYCDNSELTINNSLISGNASQYEATAIYLQESTLNMNQCTVADNIYMEESPAYTSVIYGQRSSLNISNSIIWNNAGSQIRSDYSGVDLSYSNIKGGLKEEHRVFLVMRKITVISTLSRYSLRTDTGLYPQIIMMLFGSRVIITSEARAGDGLLSRFKMETGFRIMLQAGVLMPAIRVRL
jgi:hypothetical protein